MKRITISFLLLVFNFQFLKAQSIQYASKFADENHPEIGYWFISPDLLNNGRYLEELDSIIHQCPYTLVFLTARDGANFYQYPTMHPVFKKIVAVAHQHGFKVGLQLWGNYNDKSIEGVQRMIVEDEVTLDDEGKASLAAKARFIRFPDRLLKTDLFKVYAFRKTSDGFYDPSTLKDITAKCETVLPDKETVQIKVNGGASLKGLTACIMTQEYCSQSSMWGNVEINGFKKAMDEYNDIPFDGVALDEYGNKFVERIFDSVTTKPFRGRWYSNAMAKAFKSSTGTSLIKTLFDGRYAPEGKSEVRMKAINQYMDFMRGGALRVEKAVYDYSHKVFGNNIFNGIHDTYHNKLINDEIWANGISWWILPRKYGQTDEKTFLPTRMGVAMAHTKNAMYNQYYDRVFPPVQEKALFDLRYGVRTHYHAMHDKRVNRFDLLDPEAVAGIDKVENCSRLLNKFNPLLPKIHLLVIFGIESLENWYPVAADRGVYDINDKQGIEAKAVEIWNAGYLNALVPSDLIAHNILKLDKNGKPVMNGHTFDAIVYLNPQYAKESELKFLEEYESKGGKLMVEGGADRDFNANKISKRFTSIYNKATVKGYSIENLSRLGLQKNLLPDGCKNEDDSYVFTDINSLRTGSMASFSIKIDGDLYECSYQGLAIIRTVKKMGVIKFAANGFTSLRRNGKVVLSFKDPVNIFISRQNGKINMIIKDSTHTIKPMINKL
ncbi:hypothetical protein FW778_04005 [Ginsengibacter hankyongi]|uniref:Glycoside hydrolase family 42 N-terminal domain-containing protein n=1 Tax=Ginsengibacter hankyongi TaxID=2607284 RepID=A0A5J5IMA3_9BACT|nr:hypothetical protein [Ginsengibacter hankyongi]KAA9041207.1 hypothetical protein FW778_04005 [Ginsengibacter hankyongi]